MGEDVGDGRRCWGWEEMLGVGGDVGGADVEHRSAGMLIIALLKRGEAGRGEQGGTRRWAGGRDELKWAGGRDELKWAGG